MNHISEDSLEVYLLGRFPGQINPAREDAELETIEEHLMVCEACVAQAELLEATMAAIRQALVLPATRSPRKAKLKVSTAGSGFGS